MHEEQIEVMRGWDIHKSNKKRQKYMMLQGAMSSVQYSMVQIWHKFENNVLYQLLPG